MSVQPEITIAITTGARTAGDSTPGTSADAPVPMALGQLGVAGSGTQTSDPGAPTPQDLDQLGAAGSGTQTSDPGPPTPQDLDQLGAAGSGTRASDPGAPTPQDLDQLGAAGSGTRTSDPGAPTPQDLDQLAKDVKPAKKSAAKKSSGNRQVEAATPALAAQVRLFVTGHNRKTGAHDAHAVAAVVVRTKTLRVLQLDGELEVPAVLRMLTDRRKALTPRRVQTVDRLQARAPDDGRRTTFWTATTVAACLGSFVGHVDAQNQGCPAQQHHGEDIGENQSGNLRRAHRSAELAQRRAGRRWEFRPWRKFVSMRSVRRDAATARPAVQVPTVESVRPQRGKRCARGRPDFGGAGRRLTGRWTAAPVVVISGVTTPAPSRTGSRRPVREGASGGSPGVRPARGPRPGCRCCCCRA